MKKLFCMIALLLTVCVSAFCLFACDAPNSANGDPTNGTSTSSGNSGQSGNAGQHENLTEITGVTLSNYSCNYDATAKSLEVEGEVPEGVEVKYENNDKINAGTYTVKATLSGKGFETKVLTATLTINKIPYTASVEDQTVVFDDELHLPEITGILPTGTTVTYSFNDNVSQNGVRAIGNYAAAISLSNPNYLDLTLNCMFKIKIDAVKFAKAVVNAFGNVPEPWSFLPESFAPENHTIAAAITYEDFVNVSSIPVNGIGKQLNVVYNVLNKATTALKYVNSVYNVLNAFENAYTTFLNNDPDNYGKTYNFEYGVVSASFSTVGSQYKLSASVSGFSVNVFANADGSYYGAKVELGSSNTLKYTVSENKLIIALNIVNSAATYIEFVRNAQGKVVGYIHEAVDVVNKEATLASALLEVGDTYTTIVGTKGDFVVPVYGNNRNCEVYLNSTGRLVGTEVRETLKPNSSTEYETLWYNLNSVVGINSIKKEDTSNGTNPDTIYINGKSDTIHTKLVGGISLKSASRRFDIEFKTMYFYSLNANGEYEKITCEIPMMFIQENQAETFEADFESKNDVAVTLNVSQPVKSAVNYGFHTLVNTYDEIRNSISFEDIVAYCNA